MPRYQEPREQSAALLRMVIKEMGQHDAAFNPLSFAVWYEYLGGINPRLKEALDERRKAKPRLDDETIQRLYHEYVADADASVAMRVGSDLQRVMNNIVESARTTGDAAGTYGEQLAGLSQALDSGAPQELGAMLAEALNGTQRMRSTVDGLQERLTTSMTEVEALRADLARAREEAVTDPLSGVLNRKGFDRELAALLSERPTEGMVHCLMLFDLDHFKRVNDVHGHLVGDSVIQALGQVLKRTTAESGGTCARYGGEEFAILLGNATLKQAVQMAETVRTRTKALKVRNRTNNETLLTPTVSAGIAAWVPGDDAPALIASADAALYRSKEAGRDRVTVA